jgi:hypothetical protein
MRDHFGRDRVLQHGRHGREAERGCRQVMIVLDRRATTQRSVVVWSIAGARLSGMALMVVSSRLLRSRRDTTERVPSYMS